MSRVGNIAAVCDCMVYLQAAINDGGPSAELLRFAERGNFLLFISLEILHEIKDVIQRPKTVSKYHYLSPEFAESFLLRISKVANLTRAKHPPFSFPRDPKDEKYINLAIECDADYIVSRDRDLLDLMTDHTDEAKDFRQRYRHLKIVDPVEFLRIIREMDVALEP